MPLMLLILLNLLLLLLGTVPEPISAIILTAPLLLPCANLALGLLLQPVCAGLFTTSLLTGLQPNACPDY